MSTLKDDAEKVRADVTGQVRSLGSDVINKARAEAAAAKAAEVGWLEKNPGAVAIIALGVLIVLAYAAVHIFKHG